jgi:hypothetical protein
MTYADQVLARLYPAPKGEKVWPPLAMFKALLLATWHDLSDVALAEALSDRALPALLRLFLRRGDAQAHRLRALPARASHARSRPQLV